MADPPKLRRLGLPVDFIHYLFEEPHPSSWINRSKTLHAKHFGTIDGRDKHTLVRRGDCLLVGACCPVREPAPWHL